MDTTHYRRIQNGRLSFTGDARLVFWYMDTDQWDSVATEAVDETIPVPDIRSARLGPVSYTHLMAAVQNMCMKYGARDPVFGQPEYAQIPLAVLGIVMKFFQIAISIAIAIGMAAGCIPIAGYNVGAGRNDRAKALFSRLLLAELIVGLAALLIAEVFPLPIAMLFGAANESAYYADFTVKMCIRDRRSGYRFFRKSS